MGSEALLVRFFFYSVVSSLVGNVPITVYRTSTVCWKIAATKRIGEALCRRM
jgi:hypothetical protein